MPKNKDADDNEPGRYAWRQVGWRFASFMIIYTILMLGGGFALAQHGLTQLWILLALLVLLLVAFRLTADNALLDFSPWLRGARGEQMVADLLGQLEPLGYHVINGIEFTDDHGNKQDIDHTVIGPTGVFSIETKTWKGKMWKADGDRLIHDGFDETGSVLQALGEAKEVKRRLQDGRSPVRWVEGLLVSTTSVLPERKLDFRYVTLIGASDLVPHIRDRDVVLSPGQVMTAVAALKR